MVFRREGMYGGICVVWTMTRDLSDGKVHEKRLYRERCLIVGYFLAVVAIITVLYVCFFVEGIGLVCARVIARVNNGISWDGR